MVQKFAFRFSIWHFRHKTSVSYILTENLRCKLCWKKVPFSEFNCSVLKQAFFSNWMHQKLFYPTFPLHYPKQKVKLKNVQQRIISCNCFTSAQQQPLFRKYSKYIFWCKMFLTLKPTKKKSLKEFSFYWYRFSRLQKAYVCLFYLKGLDLT